MKAAETALVLEGGATRGIFTAGVLDYMMEQELECGIQRRLPGISKPLLQGHKDLVDLFIVVSLISFHLSKQPYCSYSLQ